MSKRQDYPFSCEWMLQEGGGLMDFQIEALYLWSKVPDGEATIEKAREIAGQTGQWPIDPRDASFY